MKKVIIVILAMLPFLFACKKKKVTTPTDLPECSCGKGNLMIGDTSSFIALPTAFTPNGDGLNDVFRPIMKNFSPSSYSLTIYVNEKLVFNVTNPDSAWDGNTLEAAWSDKPSTIMANLQYTAQGKSVDTCTCIYILASSSPHSGCIYSTVSKDKYVFEDQFDPNTGTFPYTTSEVFCQ